MVNLGVNPYEPVDAWISELERKARGFEPSVDLAASVAERTFPGMRALEQMDQIERLSRNLKFTEEIALRARPGFQQLADKIAERAAVEHKHIETFEANIGRNLDFALCHPIEPMEDFHLPLKANLPEPVFSPTFLKDSFSELKQVASELIAVHKLIRQAMPVHWSRDWKFWLAIISTVVSSASLAITFLRH